MLNIVIGCDNPCELKSNSCEIAMYSKTKCSRDHNLAVLKEVRIALMLQDAMSLVTQPKGDKRRVWDSIDFILLFVTPRLL